MAPPRRDKTTAAQRGDHRQPADRLRVVPAQILELADELGCGTIERQLAKSDFKVGLEHLLRPDHQA